MSEEFDTDAEGNPTSETAPVESTASQAPETKPTDADADYIEKMKKLHSALGLPRMLEDSKAIREDLNMLSANFNKLCENLQGAQAANQQTTSTQQQGDDISPEQKMLLLKDATAGVTDLVKAWKGTPVNPMMQQQNQFNDMIMQSFAKMIQAKVDETIFSTYQTTPIPPEQMNLVRSIQNQATNISQKSPFEK